MPPGAAAVTFDDGPHPDGTPAVLDVLDELGWQAAFFMLGSAVVQFPDVAREVADRGHEIAVHGWAHRYLISRSPRATGIDLRDATEIVTSVTGVEPRWWRPPYGVLTTGALVAARRLRLHPLLWSAWGKDWRSDATATSITRVVTRGRLDGGTILLHDSDATSAAASWRKTVQALPLIAEQLTVRGIRVAPLRPSVPVTPTVTLGQDQRGQPTEQRRGEHDGRRD